MDIVGNVRKLVRRGYGFNQMLTELNIKKEDLIEACNKNLVFKNELEKRYSISLSIVEENRENGRISEGQTENRRKKKGNTKPSDIGNKGDDTHSIE